MRCFVHAAFTEASLARRYAKDRNETPGFYLSRTMPIPIRYKICWFCGDNAPGPAAGHSIPSMAYCSEGVCSEEAKEWMRSGQPTGREADAAAMCWARVCQDCLLRFRSTLLPIAAAESREAARISSEQLEETCDVDTFLRDNADVRLPFWCWFSGLPQECCSQSWWSLPLGDLFSRGLKLEGSCTIKSVLMQRFLDRFAAPNSCTSSSSSPLFVEQVRRGFKLEDDQLVAQMAGVRATISNHGVLLYAHKVRPSWVMSPIPTRRAASRVRRTS